MQGKKERDSSTSPCIPGHATEDQEQQETVHDMKEKVHQMVSGRVRAKNPDVQHVRDPSQGMPVVGIERRERPPDTVWIHTLLHMGILDDVIGIIEVYEFVILHRPVNDDRADNEKNADEKAFAPPTFPIYELSKHVFLKGHDRHTVSAESSGFSVLDGSS